MTGPFQDPFGGGAAADPFGGSPADIKKLLERGFSMEAVRELARTGKLTQVAKTQGIQGPRAGTLNTRTNSISGLPKKNPLKVGDLGKNVGLASQKSSVSPFNFNGLREIGKGIAGVVGGIKQGVVKGNDRKEAYVNKLSEAEQRYNRILGKTLDAKEQQDAAATDPSAFMDDYSAPVLERRDFSEEANRLAASAYGPQYAALDAGRNNARSQYSTSDEVVKGLYEKLVGDIKTEGQTAAQGYDQAGQDAANRSSALQDRIGQNYDAAANQEAALLQQLGAEQAAPDIIPDDRGFQQGEAAAQGTAQQDYYAAQKQGNTDYMSKLGQAQNTQGTVERQGLLQQLSGVLAQYDQQQQNLSGEQSQTALDISGRLTDQDMQAQQFNIGAQQNSQQMAQSAAQAAAQSQQSALDRQYSQGRDQRADMESDRAYSLDENKFKVDALLAQGQAGANSDDGGQLKFDQLPGLQQLSAQASQIVGGQGQAYVDFATQLGQESAGILDTIDMQGFMRLAAEKAGRIGMSQGAAAAIAGEYWKNILGRR